MYLKDFLKSKSRIKNAVKKFNLEFQFMAALYLAYFAKWCRKILHR